MAGATREDLLLALKCILYATPGRCIELPIDALGQARLDSFEIVVEANPFTGCRLWLAGPPKRQPLELVPLE